MMQLLQLVQLRAGYLADVRVDGYTRLGGQFLG